MKRNNILVAMTLASCCLPAIAQNDIQAAKAGHIEDQTIDVGANKTFSLSESTASVSVIENKDVDKRSAKNIRNSIVGQGLGLITQLGGGKYASQEASMIVRGLHSLSGSGALVLVDGIERSINDISADEVESVSILKDAAAVALYGYKGANGAILVTTKRGEKGVNKVEVTYDHIFNNLVSTPKFVDAGTYADAINEAYKNDGLEPRYTADEVKAFKDGSMPQYYPNVNWFNEVFRHHGVTNKYGVQFTGGTGKTRYYTALNLLSDKGFVKNPNMTDGYSTQDKYVKGNLRINLDVDITKTTQLKVNLFGSLSEQSAPGSNANLWSMLYTVPAAAFPIQSNGMWGGSETWAGTSNPVAQATGAAYFKYHTRDLFSDMTLNQRLDAITPGLSATLRLGFDAQSTLTENHSKTYQYNVTTIPQDAWHDGVLDESMITNKVYGSAGESSEVKTSSYGRRFHFDGGLNYDRSFGKHDVYSQLRWDYEFEDILGTNVTIYRQNATWFTHYGYAKKYFADFSLVASGSNKLAPGHKWAISPTLSAAWVLSNESFMKNVSWVSFLKLRASAGMLNMDLLPNDDTNWTYYIQGYSDSGPSYIFGSNYEANAGRSIGALATANPNHEKAYMYNVGVEARLFDGLNLTVEGFYNHRTNIWVSGSGAYSSIVAFGAPYINAGIVNQKGMEVGLDYTKTLGDVTLNVGGNYLYSENQVKAMAEEPRAYPNLVKTGNQLNQLYGLKAIGFFKDEADIANSPTQTFSSVVPGDVKYEDVNHDGKIDANDEVAIGHSTTPGIYYQFHLGAEWKGLGFNMMFQGTGKYSGMLNTKGMYWPLIGNSNISQYAYDNRWTPETAETALYPRLSSTSNDNNYRNSTLWLVDRSYLKLRNVELYYKLPASVFNSLKFVHGAILYLRGVDLFCWDHIPEGNAESYGATQPLTRSVVAGVKLTF